LAQTYTRSNAPEQARALEVQGEGYYRLSDIGEAQRLWTTALKIRQVVFGDSATETTVGYAYQARYHSYMAGPQPDHRALARSEAERARRLLKSSPWAIAPSDRIFILREYAYAFKVSEMGGALEDSTRLRRTRSFFHEALDVAMRSRDTTWIAQIMHDIGNTFTDEVGRYNQMLSPERLRVLTDSGLHCYRRSTALITETGNGNGGSVMMDHLTTALLYRSAYGPDSSAKAVAAFDRALRTMLRVAGRPGDIDPLTYEPRITNKAQMVELLYLRSFAFADPYTEHVDAQAVRSALACLEAAVPYWEAVLREYKSRDMYKVLGSYSHFPFRYGTYLAAELSLLGRSPDDLRQALLWYDRDKDGLEQRDRMRSGSTPRTTLSSAMDISELAMPSGSVCIAFHDFPRPIAFVIDQHGARIVALEVVPLAERIEELNAAMRANDPRSFQRIAYELYENLLSKVFAGNDYEKVVVVPSTSMAGLPFEALVTDTVPAPGGWKLFYVQHQHRIRYARTIREGLAPPIDLPTQRMNWAVAEAPGLAALPFSATLARQRAERNDGELLVGTTRSQFSSFLLQDLPLHLVAHAEAPTGSEEEARLLLNDGAFSWSAIDSVGCKLPLVVMSTCSSGAGRVYIGEGTLSLGNALLRNGAGTVVQTLWPVDDQATSEVMEGMYDGLEDGLSVSEALAEAKRRFVDRHAEDALGNPFYWSGIVVTGRELRMQNERGVWPFWIGGAILLAAAGYRSFRRSKRSRALADS